MKLFIHQYFGKDWKFFWKTSKAWEAVIRKPSTWIGLNLLRLSRSLLRIGRDRCSWCGAKQNRNTGIHMSASRKGMRCDNTPVSCSDR